LESARRGAAQSARLARCLISIVRTYSSIVRISSFFSPERLKYFLPLESMKLWYSCCPGQLSATAARRSAVLRTHPQALSQRDICPVAIDVNDEAAQEGGIDLHRCQRELATRTRMRP
jgi:hypothetical protein